MRAKDAALGPFLDERRRRLWAASEAQALGRGGVKLVAAATGLARSTLGDGLRELRAASPAALRATAAPAAPAAPHPLGRQRRAGGGRKALTHHDPDLVPAREALAEPTTRGDPQSPLRWTPKSTRALADELACRGHPVSAATVATLLHQLTSRRHALRTTTAGASPPDRDAQFARIDATVHTFQERGQPVVSVDAKKKDLGGDCKNGGREGPPEGRPEAVRGHDFPDKAPGEATPDGIDDPAATVGWVSVGTDHDTATFAVDRLHRWWQQMGAPTHPDATDSLVTADGGGSNGSRARLWQAELRRLADATGLRVQVCRVPPGTSTWNDIAHGLFCRSTQTWRGRPLVSHEVIVELIGHTTTRKGPRVQAELNPRAYPTGTKVSDDAFAAVRLERAAFHGDWNYTIPPRAVSL